MTAVFEAAILLSEEGILPEFPDDEASWEEVGIWLVAAKDEDFFDFVLGSRQGQD